MGEKWNVCNWSCISLAVGYPSDVCYDSADAVMRQEKETCSDKRSEADSCAKRHSSYPNYIQTMASPIEQPGQVLAHQHDFPIQQPWTDCRGLKTRMSFRQRMGCGRSRTSDCDLRCCYGWISKRATALSLMQQPCALVQVFFVGHKMPSFLKPSRSFRCERWLAKPF